MELNESTIIKEWSSYNFSCILNYLNERNDIKIFVDIGANIGISTEFITKNIKSIEKSYLFEPDKDNFQLLQQRIETLKINAIPINKAIYYSDKDKMSVFGVGDNNAGGQFLEDVIKDNVKNKKNLEDYHKEFVLARLETEVPEQIDFIKLDVEGSEYNIIEFSEKVKNVKYLLVEFHWKSVEEKKDFIKQFLIEKYNIVYSFEMYHHVLFERKS